ncbi:MAG: T9SS type A sorting domain-containing protein [Sphingobacteriales bacterium]|nr:MAG: T9SS type A sorting domain-containing protein [Sphingobacteriales bacterium]
MRRLFTPLLLILLLFVKVSAQPNMVPNGSFETYTSCPTGYSQINFVTGWNIFTTGGSSDYYNSCNTGSVSVPSNSLGSEAAADGNGYAGFYSNAGSGDYREYIYRPMSSLTIGVRYEVSISASLSDFSKYGGTGLGVYFFDNGPSSLPGNTVVNVVPQVDYSSYGPLTIQNGWIRLVGYLTADSAYDNIVIGNFRSISNMTTALAGGGNNYSYYYVDSIIVKQLPKISFVYPDSSWCVGDSIVVPFYANSDSFNTGNVFTLQLSNSSGSFTSNITSLATISGRGSDVFRLVVPSTITGGAGYRMRIVASSPSFASYDNGKDISIGAITLAKPIIIAASPACTADTLRLYASTTTTGTFSWYWKGPNNFTSTQQNPKIAMPTSVATGDYYVTVYNYGCSAKDTDTVVISASPNAITALSNSAICQEDTLKLYSTASSSGVGYGWTGPNGFTASTQNPFISNAQPGVSGKYYVTATATNGCYRKDSVTVDVKAKPYINATNSGPVCEAANLSLTATTSAAGAIFSWVGPSTYTSATQNPTISPVALNHAGTYIVTAGLNGCSDTGVTTVVVNASPTLSVGSNSPLCLLDTIKLSSAASTGVTYSWTGPGSFTSTTANPFMTNAALVHEGYYRLMVTGTSGCTRTDSVSVTTKPLPVIYASNTTPVCAGEPFGLNTSTTYTGVSYLWSGPNSFSSAAANPSLASSMVSSSGTYTLKTTMNGCSYTTTTNAVVHPVPVAQAGAQLPVCVGGTMQLIGNSLSGATYYWSGPSYTSTLQSPSFPANALAQSGNYILTITANGCVSLPDTVNVKVNVLSRIGGYVSPNDTICAGAIPTFVAFVQDGGPAPVAQWYKNNVPVGASNALQYTPPTISDGDVYYCKLTAPGVCYTTLVLYTDTIDMTVLPVVTKPEVEIIANPGLHVRPADLVKFTAKIKHGGTTPKYQWFKNGIKQTGATQATFDATGLSYMDMIHVDIISEDPCAQNKNASDTVWVQFPTGIRDAHTGSVRLYPNPNNGSFTIAGIDASEANVEAVNAIGQVLHRTNVVVIGGEARIDAQLLPGTYLLKLKAGAARHNIKMTVY